LVAIGSVVIDAFKALSVVFHTAEAFDGSPGSIGTPALSSSDSDCSEPEDRTMVGDLATAIPVGAWKMFGTSDFSGFIESAACGENDYTEVDDAWNVDGTCAWRGADVGLAGFGAMNGTELAGFGEMNGWMELAGFGAMNGWMELAGSTELAGTQADGCIGVAGSQVADAVSASMVP